MVRDRGRHSLQARGRHTLVLWEQGVKKTERGRKEKQNKTIQIRKITMPIQNKVLVLQTAVTFP